MSDSDSDSDQSDAEGQYCRRFDEENRKWKDQTPKSSSRAWRGTNGTPGHQSVSVKHTDRQGVSFDFKTLTQWATSINCDDLVQTLTQQLDVIKKVLARVELPIDWVHFFALSFQKVLSRKYQGTRVCPIMEVVAHSNFLDSHIPDFLSKVGENEKVLSGLIMSLRALLDILDYIAIRFSDCSNRCFLCVCEIEETATFFHLLKEGSELHSRCLQLKTKSCPIPLSDEFESIYPGWNTRRRVRAVPMDDESSPPDDFAEKSIFPDMDELEATCVPFLRANKTQGPYRDLQHYTDVHFRLLREDYLSPLREGLNVYRQMNAVGQEVKTMCLRFYYEVQLVDLKINDNDGIHFVVKFKPKNLGEIEIDWEFSKRFLFGSLLCFSKDDFQTVMFATVTDRDPKELERGLLKVCFQSNLEHILVSSEKDSFVIAETVSFFESYKHVLEGLQEVSEIPLEDYILYCCPDPIPPEYLTPRMSYDISCIMKQNIEKEVKLLDPSDWPDHESTVLNAAQLEAVKLALTNELAIIQGPPGTGKTFVGLHIMELLLKNRPMEGKNHSPILVVCYTNHALDQFLEGMLEFSKGGIIRVGTRSTSEHLKDFNLKELRKNPKMDKRLKSSINFDLKECRKRLNKVSYLIRRYWQESLSLDTAIQSVHNLEEEMTSYQISSMTDPARSGGHGNEMNIWLKASNASMENHVKKAAERHLIKLVLADGLPELPDSYLLRCVNPSFEYRAKIYRGWVTKYKEEKRKKLSELLPNDAQLGSGRLIEELIEATEKAKNDILEDEDILPYISSEKVFEKIKECNSHKQHRYIRIWLLGCFGTVEQIFSEIEKLTNVQIRPQQGNNFSEKRFNHGQVVVDDDDDSDCDVMLGFRDCDSDQEDDEALSISSGSGANEMVKQFRDLVVDYNYAEKREITLLRRAKMLHIEMSANEEKEDLNDEGGWSHANRMTYTKVIKLIDNAKPLREKEALEIQDVWSLSLIKRYSLYKYWILSKKREIVNEIIQLTDKYNEFLKLKKRALMRKDIAILRKGQVIGMTTTGAARYRAVLQEVKPQIIIVEEAAEVLEAHIVTTLNRHCKHLILIGDHQQLRPSPTMHTLAIDYDLEISLFERLVKNRVRQVTLQIQHRMRPEVSKYLQIIYPMLRNHKSVSLYGDVKGVGSNVYFLNHNYRESEIIDSTSKANVHEAKFITKLCKYFLQQGYSTHQITILAAYGGQVAVLRECMEPEEDLYKHVRVTSIDNYQGEENDIILLSLVRSNLEQDVGFLRISNRVCVALSRARQGLFAMGNFLNLEQRSKLWQTIMMKARVNNEIGVALKLICMNHPHREVFVQHAEDFELHVPEGGCDQICGAELFCGHTCGRKCHIDDPSHSEMLCEEACLHQCPQGHPCPKKCHEDCGDCEILVKKDMPLCGHKDFSQCYLDVFDAVCKQPCKQLLQCGHLCQGLCGDCSRTCEHRDCEELVEKTWNLCGDKCMVACCTDVKIAPCEAKCREKLRCGHNCRGTCGECLTKRVHRPCQEECKKALPCGHQCQSKCSMPCEPCKFRCLTMCRHAPCSKDTCGEICEVCRENCAFVCQHQICSKQCADECTKAPCNRLCNKLIIKCKHSCSSICGEDCICYKCDVHKEFSLIDFAKSKPGKTAFADAERAKKFVHDEDTKFMKIPRCGHIFTRKQLDQYVENYDPGGTSYIRCPRCKNTIQGINRYDCLNKSRSSKRENRKHQLIELSIVSEDVIEKLQDSLIITNDFCPFDLEYHLRHKNETITRSHADALRGLSRFAYALNMIVDVHKEFNSEIPFNADKYKKAMKSCQTGITAQYEEEMTMELHRLLILEQLVSYKKLADEAGVILSEPLNNGCKRLMKHEITQKLTQSTKIDAEDIISHLLKEFLSSEVVMATQGDAENIFRKSYLIKTILDKPRQMYLYDIMDAENILPCPVEDEQDDEESLESSDES